LLLLGLWGAVLLAHFAVDTASALVDSWRRWRRDRRSADDLDIE
jgi:hypothetical protein